MTASQIAAGKKMGLSVAEIRRMTVAQVLMLADAYFPRDESAPRKATQADIDRLFSL